MPLLENTDFEENEMSELQLHPQAAASLQRWHAMVAQGDLSDLPKLLDAKAVFRSPMAHTSYPGARVASTILNTVVQVFQDFTYHRQLATGDGLSVVLEFSARVGDRQLKGIDMIRFDESGKIVEFEVMVRPMSGLQALGDEMGSRLASYLAASKAQAGAPPPPPFSPWGSEDGIMASTAVLDFLVDRDDLSRSELREQQLDAEALAPGQALLRIDHFAFTANNITYAVMGEAMHYWQFFPAPAGKGLIPVWGFAEVQASRCEGVEPGVRFYGCYPMSTHLVVEPVQVKESGFVDGREHRRPLPILYNQYLRCSRDPLYRAGSEALQMLLRPLFTTSFLLDDFFADNHFFNAERLVLTSASSKTAIGMAYLLHRDRGQREQRYEIVGLTSPANRAFVEGLGCYDRVLGYDQVTELDAGVPTATVDFAGNGELLGRLHAHFAAQLRHSCLVGASHWHQRGGLPKNLPGAAPQLFFAPAQAEKRLLEWGGAGFHQRLAERWSAFTTFTGQWLSVEHGLGPDAVKRVYREVLAGHASPQTGHILSLFSSRGGSI